MLTKRQFSALALVTLFGSFAGGAVMEWLLTGKGARAGGAEKVIRADRFEAREFRVVDENGTVGISLGMQSRIGLVDGKPLAKYGVFIRDAILCDGQRFSSTLTADSIASNDHDLGDRTMMEPGRVVLSVGLHDKGTATRFCELRAGSIAVLGEAPTVQVLDGQGTPRAVLGCIDFEDKRTESVVKRQESSLVLFKSDGDVLWKAP